MITLLLAFILAGASAAQSSVVFRTPTRADLERIDMLIADAKPIMVDLEAAQKDLAALKRRRDRLERAPANDRSEELSKLRFAIQLKTSETRNLMSKRNRAFDKALTLVLDSTMMADSWPEGTTHVKPYTGTFGQWKIFAGDNEDIPWVGPDGEPIVFPKAVDRATGEEPIAHTLPNGMTVVHPRAFDTAETLILTVAHEQGHFELNQREDNKDATSAEDEVVCYKYEQTIAEFIEWRSEAHKAAYLAALGEKIAEKRDLASDQRARKDRGEYREEPDVRRAPGLDVDITPIFTRAEKIRKSVSEASVRLHLETLYKMAERDCLPEPLESAEFDALPKLEDRRYYEKEKLRFSGQTLKTCQDRRYVDYMGTLAAGQRIIPLPRALPPMRSPFPPPVAAPPPAPGPVAAPPSLPVDGEDNLRRLIRIICADPYGFSRPAVQVFQWFPVPRTHLTLQGAGQPNACEGTLGDVVQEWNRQGHGLDVEELARRAMLYKQQPVAPPPGSGQPGGCGPANPGTGLIGCPVPR